MKKFFLSMAACAAALGAFAGDGSEENPYTVQDLLNMKEGTINTQNNAYCIGYIAGYIVGSSFTEETCKFDANEGAIQSNILLADEPNCTDWEKVSPIGLKSGSDPRAKLNLAANPNNLNYQVKVKGTLKAYFGQPGIKDVTAFEWTNGEPPASVQKEYKTGTSDAPLSVAQFLEDGTPNDPVADTWLDCVIIGVVTGNPVDAEHTQLEAGESGFSVAANILVAASAEETDYAKMIPVALPAGDIRDALNLQDHPENLGKRVVLCGSHQAYYGANGLKSLTDYRFENGETPDSVEEIAAEGAAKWYTLQGVEVKAPVKGIYVKVAAGKASKVIVK